MEPFDLDIDSSKFTETRIYKAIKQGNHHKVLQALHTGENVHLTDPDFHTTYLHVVCSLAESHNEDKYVPIVYQLSNAGININDRDYKGRTALELAIGRELHDTMVGLIRCGAEVTSRDYKQMVRDSGSPFEYELINAIEKYEPGLWQCVLRNETGMIHMLINSWCRINITRQGVTLLQMARQTHKTQELINVLDDYEVTIEFVHATLAGDEKRMLEFLMDSKPCDPNIMDISYQERWSLPLEPRSLRDTAFCMGHTHILHLLPEDEAPLPGPGGGGGEQRPARHIREKGRSDTVMAITSLNGYLPDGSDVTRPLHEESEDEDTQEIDAEDSFIHKFRPSTARSERYRTNPSTEDPSDLNPKLNHPTSVPSINFTGPKTMSLNTASPFHEKSSSRKSNNGAVDFANMGSLRGRGDLPPGYGEREYYFHEVDSFVGQYYVEDGSDPPYKTYICKPDGEHMQGRKMMKKTDKKPMRSKMCVIS